MTRMRFVVAGSINQRCDVSVQCGGCLLKKFPELYKDQPEQP